MHRACLADLMSLFTPEDYRQIVGKIELISDEYPFIAEDNTGASYNHGEDGFKEPGPEHSAAKWLGVKPRPEEPLIN